MIGFDSDEDPVERCLQNMAIKLSMELSSEESVETSRRRAEATRVFTGQIVLFAILASTGDFLIARFAPADFYRPDVGLGIFIVASLIIVLCMLYRSEATARMRLHEPIANNDLCAQIVVLASHSSAVTQYIRDVTAGGRELRRFDIARINMIYKDERVALAGLYEGDACVALHGL